MSYHFIQRETHTLKQLMTTTKTCIVILSIVKRFHLSMHLSMHLYYIRTNMNLRIPLSEYTAPPLQQKARVHQTVHQRNYHCGPHGNMWVIEKVTMWVIENVYRKEHECKG